MLSATQIFFFPFRKRMQALSWKLSTYVFLECYHFCLVLLLTFFSVNPPPPSGYWFSIADIHCNKETQMKKGLYLNSHKYLAEYFSCSYCFIKREGFLRKDTSPSEFFTLTKIFVKWIEKEFTTLYPKRNKILYFI